jgi:hypothetical protein
MIFILTLDIARFTQTLTKGTHPVLEQVWEFGAEITDHETLLLRARRERPRGCRTAEERDELAPSLSSAAATWPFIFQARTACKARPVFCQPAVGICSLWRVGQ